MTDTDESSPSPWVPYTDTDGNEGWYHHERKVVKMQDTRPDRVTKESAWQPYEGPQGGQGWYNSQTDEVRYQDPKPGTETADAADTGPHPDEAFMAGWRDVTEWHMMEDDRYEVQDRASDYLTDHTAIDDVHFSAFSPGHIREMGSRLHLLDSTYDLSDVDRLVDSGSLQGFGVTGKRTAGFFTTDGGLGDDQHIGVLPKSIQKPRIMGMDAGDWLVTNCRYQTIVHETAHYLHFQEYEAAFDDPERKWNRPKQFDTDEETVIREEVSEYAVANPFEAVAEIATGLMYGYEFSDDVMAIYEKYNGPAVTDLGLEEVHWDDEEPDVTTIKDDGDENPWLVEAGIVQETFEDLFDALSARTEKANSWQSYEGPQGGQGWYHPGRDEVRYTDDPPDAGTTTEDNSPITADEANDSPQKWVEVVKETERELDPDTRPPVEDAHLNHVADLFLRGFGGDQIKSLVQNVYDPEEHADDLANLYEYGLKRALDTAGPDAEIYEGSIDLADRDSTLLAAFQHEEDRFVTDTADKVGEGWADSLGSTVGGTTYPLYKLALDRYENDRLPENVGSLEDELLFGPPDEWEQRKDALETHLRRTRELYRTTIGDTVPVFRGITPSDSNAADKIRQRLEQEDVDEVRIQNTVLNSWTTDPTLAKDFAEETLEGDYNPGFVVRREVPVEDIMLSGDTNEGLFGDESEIVVGNDQEYQMSDTENVIKPENFDQFDQARWLVDRIYDDSEPVERADTDAPVTIAWEDSSHGWLHRLRDADTDENVAKTDGSTWERYRGPQGGEGWRNRRTGEIRYQQSRPPESGQTTGQSSAAWTAWNPGDDTDESSDGPVTENDDPAESAGREELTWETIRQGDEIAYRNDTGEYEIGEIGAIEPDFQNPGQQVAWVVPEGQESEIPVREAQFEGDANEVYQPTPLNPAPVDYSDFKTGDRVVVDLPQRGQDNQIAEITDVLTYDDGTTRVDVRLADGTETHLRDAQDSPIEFEGVLPRDEFAVQHEVEFAPDPHPQLSDERGGLGRAKSVGKGIQDQWKRIQDKAPTDDLELYFQKRIDQIRDDSDYHNDHTRDHTIINDNPTLQTLQGILATRDDSDIDPSDAVSVMYAFGLDDDEKESLADPDDVEADFDATLGQLNDYVAAHTLATVKDIEITPIGDKADEHPGWVGMWNADRRTIKIEKTSVSPGFGSKNQSESVTAHELGHAIHYFLGLDYASGTDNRGVPADEWAWEFDVKSTATDESHALYETLTDEWQEMQERVEQEEDAEVFMPNTELNKPLREYQTMNGDEFFAVAFGHWVSDYNKLHTDMPGVAEAFDTHLGKGRDPIDPATLDEDHIGDTVLFESRDIGRGIPGYKDTPSVEQVAKVVGFTDAEEHRRQVAITDDENHTEDTGEWVREGGRHVELKAGYKEYTVPVSVMDDVEVVQQ